MEILKYIGDKKIRVRVVADAKSYNEDLVDEVLEDAEAENLIDLFKYCIE
jgi:hypothetical protein